MKKSITILKSSTILYAFCFFFLNMMWVSTEFWFFNFISYEFGSNHIEQCLIANVVVLLLSVVFAIIVQQLTSIGRSMLFLTIALLIDPLLKCMFLNATHIMLLAISLLLCSFLFSGKSFVTKTILTAVFVIFSMQIAEEAIFCYVPLVGLFYCSCYLRERRETTCSNTNRNRKAYAENNKSLKIANISAMILIALFLVSIYVKKTFSNDYFMRWDMKFRLCDADYFVKKPYFWVSLLPYVLGLIIFIVVYFSVKLNGKNITSKFLDKQYFLGVVVITLSLASVGCFVYNYASCVTVLNLISIGTIVILRLWLDPVCAEKAFVRITDFIKKYKVIFLIAFIFWFFVVQYFFEDVYPSAMINLIVDTSGETL